MAKSKKTVNLKSAVLAVNQHGMLLVFPIANSPQPPSLWSYFFPRTPMRWEWDESGDDRVSKLWYLREELSSSRKVVYGKWYRGRATVFSREVFTAMLSIFMHTNGVMAHLSPQALEILSLLKADSPLSTKSLKKMSDLSGKRNEAAYQRALKELWSRLLIVGFGEIDEGAFPSLAIGATEVIFEDLWNEAHQMSEKKAEKILLSHFPKNSLIQKYFEKQKRNFSHPTPQKTPDIHSNKA